MKTLAETHRRGLTLALAHVGWWGAFLFTVLAVRGDVSRPIGTIVIMFVGIAIAASLSLSRMRLTDTITSVFEAGLSAAVVLQTSIDARTCVIETDQLGVIDAVENPGAIGWDSGALYGHPIVGLIGDSAGRAALARRIGPASAISGRTMTLPILTSGGTSSTMRVTVSRVGALHIATITPFTQRRRTTDEPSAATP